MSVYLNYWHYIVFFVLFLIWISGIVASSKLKDASHKFIMAMSLTFIILLSFGFSIVIVDKYTKIASLHKLKSKRLLSIEKTVYSGIIRNDGKHTIGEVTFEIKLVNKAHSTGGPSGNSMYKAGGFFDFLSGGADILYKAKAQTVTNEFVVVKNLKPGKSKAFRIYINYPTYFKYASYSTKLYLH
jgi:hypothetical protein